MNAWDLVRVTVLLWLDCLLLLLVFFSPGFILLHFVISDRVSAGGADHLMRLHSVCRSFVAMQTFEFVSCSVIE